MVDPTTINVTTPPPIYLMARRAPLDEPKKEKIGAYHVIMIAGALAAVALAASQFRRKR